MILEDYNSTVVETLGRAWIAQKYRFLNEAAPCWLSDTAVYGSEYFEAVAALREISTLDDDWDGYGAARIRSSVISNAWRALEYFAARKLIPEIAPNAHGTISFEWDSEHAIAHFEVGHENYAMYIRPSKGATSYFDGKASKLSSALADSLGEALRGNTRSASFGSWSITPICYETGSRALSYQ